MQCLLDTKFDVKSIISCIEKISEARMKRGEKVIKCTQYFAFCSILRENGEKIWREKSSQPTMLPQR